MRPRGCIVSWKVSGDGAGGKAVCKSAPSLYKVAAVCDPDPGSGAGEAENLESYIKDAAISKLAQIYTLAYIATDHQLTLSDDEQAKAEQAASAYYASLNEKEKKYMDVSERMCRNCTPIVCWRRKPMKN